MRTRSESPGAADQQAILAVVQRQVAELAGDVGQGNVDGLPPRRIAGYRGGHHAEHHVPMVVVGLRVAGGGNLHDEFGIGRGGDDDIDAIIGPRRALTDQQAAFLEPHRARFVGFDSQRPGFGNGPAADGDRTFP